MESVLPPSMSPRSASASSNGSGVFPPEVQVKPESDSDKDADVGSEDEDLRVFEAKPCLPVARVEHRTLQDLMDLLKTEAVDLNPDYQRDVVWDNTRKMGLIDSIIENYYIPPILFNRQIDRSGDGSGRIKRVCIDGKQRLSSVKAFMDGTIGCHDRRGGVWYYTNDGRASKATRRTIPEHVKELFRNQKFICYEYPNLLQAQEEDLFSRVQLGMQLSTAEKVRASTGPWQDFAKLYERDFPKVVELSSLKRSAGFNNVLMSFVQILEVRRCVPNSRPDLKAPFHAAKALFKNTKDYNPENRDILRRTFTRFQELIEVDPQTFVDNGYQFAKLFSPFEMVTSSALISIFMEDKDDQFLLDSIRGMRFHIRQHLKDIRMNKSTWNVAWDFIMGLDSFPKAHEPENLAKAHWARAAPQGVVPSSLPVLPNQPGTPSNALGQNSATSSSSNPTPRVPSNHTPSDPSSGARSRDSYAPASTSDPQPAPLDTSCRAQLQRAVNLRLQQSGGVQTQQSNDNILHPLDGMQFQQPAARPQPRARKSNGVGSISVQPSPDANREPANRTKLAHSSSTQSRRLTPTQHLLRTISGTTEPSSVVDQGSVASTQSVSGIKKKRLARFTTSDASSKGRGKEQDAEPARQSGGSMQEPITQEPPRPEAASSTQRNRKRPSEPVIEVSDDEDTEAAEELLAKFRPHVVKRIKVEDSSEV